MAGARSASASGIPIASAPRTTAHHIPYRAQIVSGSTPFTAYSRSGKRDGATSRAHALGGVAVAGD